MNRLIWFYAGGILLLFVAILAFVFWPAAPKSVEQAAGKLTRKEQRTVTADRDSELHAADAKRTAADRATTNAEILIRQGNYTAAEAAALRLKSHALRPSPALTSDTAVARLERRWADWRP